MHFRHTKELLCLGHTQGGGTTPVREMREGLRPTMTQISCSCNGSARYTKTSEKPGTWLLNESQLPSSPNLKLASEQEKGHLARPASTSVTQGKGTAIGDGVWVRQPRRTLENSWCKAETRGVLSITLKTWGSTLRTVLSRGWRLWLGRTLQLRGCQWYPKCWRPRGTSRPPSVLAAHLPFSPLTIF